MNQLLVTIARLEISREHFPCCLPVPCSLQRARFSPLALKCATELEAVEVHIEPIITALGREVKLSCLT